MRKLTLPKSIESAVWGAIPDRKKEKNKTACRGNAWKRGEE
tara:strand:- start:386 stop:508 length:123 start_codon:yes stop_codon:yes gene_type:complete